MQQSNKIKIVIAHNSYHSKSGTSLHNTNKITSEKLLISDVYKYYRLSNLPPQNVFSYSFPIYSGLGIKDTEEKKLWLKMSAVNSFVLQYK